MRIIKIIIIGSFIIGIASYTFYNLFMGCSGSAHHSAMVSAFMSRYLKDLNQLPLDDIDFKNFVIDITNESPENFEWFEYSLSPDSTIIINIKDQGRCSPEYDIFYTVYYDEEHKLKLKHSKTIKKKLNIFQRIFR
jgi:hypothetical protein